MSIEVALLALALVCAILSARWAMELGFSQLGQLLWGIAGFLGGPVVLLILYVRLLRGASGSAKRWF
jgi:hypothetical protein